MKVDRQTKVILVLIGVALWLIALNPWLKSEVAKAAIRAESFDCRGELKANEWGGANPSIGGYKVSLSCS